MTMLLRTIARFQLNPLNYSSSRNLKYYLSTIPARPLFLNKPHHRSLHIASSAKEYQQNVEGPSQNFQEIYRFPFIRLGYAINKLKWTQTLLLAFAIPTSVAVYFSGMVDSEMILSIVIPGILTTVNLYAYGSLFDQAVGFMYLSEDGSTLKISYLDFWGARVNMEVPVDDVTPLTDSPWVFTEYFYRTIHLYSTEKIKPKLFLKVGGKITDKNKFVRVFGDYTASS